MFESPLETPGRTSYRLPDMHKNRRFLVGCTVTVRSHLINFGVASDLGYLSHHSHLGTPKRAIPCCLVGDKSSSEIGFAVDTIGISKLPFLPFSLDFPMTVGIETTLYAFDKKSLQCFHAVSILRNRVDAVASDLSNCVSPQLILFPGPSSLSLLSAQSCCSYCIANLNANQSLFGINPHRSF